MSAPSDRRLHTLSRTTQLLRGRANRHAWIGLGIAVAALVAATLLACRYEYGDYSLHNLLATQQGNPALWLLDLMPLLFLLWGQHIGTVLSYQAGALVLDETQELRRQTERLQYELERGVPGQSLGLPNRHGLIAQIERMIADREEHPGAGFAVLALDTANYREIEPAHGTEASHQFLAQLSERLHAVSGEGDVLAHFGFDQFAMLLSHASDPAVAQQLATRVHLALETPLSLGRRPLAARCTIGVACYPEHGNNAETLLRRAETARSLAAADGRDLLVYEHSLDSPRTERSRLRAELHAALNNDALGESYRLQLPLRADLPPRLRLSPFWDHPRLGRLDETHFVDLPDRQGLAYGLSLWLLRHGLDHIAGQRDAGAPHLVLRLPSLALREPSLADMVLRLISAHDLPASSLIIEAPEPALIALFRSQPQQLAALRAGGVRLALADVGGPGTSPLTPTDVPLDECRLAEDLLDRAVHDPRLHATVGALAQLLRIQRASIVATAVDDDARLALAREIGADYAESSAALPPTPSPATADSRHPVDA